MKRKPKQQPKPCKKCGQDAIIGEKYCKACKSIVLKELDDQGYFQSLETTKAPSDQMGRGQRASLSVGGSAEMLDDGDDE